MLHVETSAKATVDLHLTFVDTSKTAAHVQSVSINSGVRNHDIQYSDLRVFSATMSVMFM
jgi:hypothetical protein